MITTLASGVGGLKATTGVAEGNGKGVAVGVGDGSAAKSAARVMLAVELALSSSRAGFTRVGRSSLAPQATAKIEIKNKDAAARTGIMSRG